MTDAPRGMVLAAGFGTRLAPLTTRVPKPLLTVGGISLLDRAVNALIAAGCVEVGINTHHLAASVAEHVGRARYGVPVTLFREPEILGTGGALDNAREFLGAGESFLVHNADILYTGSLDGLTASDPGTLAALLLADWPAVNTVVCRGDRVVSLRGQGEGRRLTYTGIGRFHRALLDDIPAGFSSLIDPLERALIHDATAVRAVAADGAWADLGTPGRYLDSIDSAGERGGPLTVTPLAGQGSDRRFWRLAAPGWSAVAMQDVPGSEEFSRQVEITAALAEAELGTATTLAVDSPNSALVMEDLGDRDLWASAAACPDDPAAWVALYAPVVDRLLALQEAGRGSLRDLAPAWDRRLDHAGLRWETDYFRERFLVGHLGMDPDALANLRTEFEALAAVVAAQPVVLIHRDYQSRNIMLQDGRVRLVDIQGLRAGPLHYDLASLLWDPYVAMPPAVRTALLERFAAGLGEPADEAFRVGHLAAALQRLMQALGAFGFLGHIKGKREFLAHMPAGVRHLRLALTALKDHHVGVPGHPGPLPGLEGAVAVAAEHFEEPHA